MLRVLLYADDLALLAESQLQLQQILDCLHQFSEACCMTVNTGKSEVVCFNREFAPKRLSKFMYNGVPLPVKEQFRYLGVPFNQSGKQGGVCDAGDSLLKAAKRAMAVVWQRCYALKI